MASNFKLNLFHILQFLYSNMNIYPVDFYKLTFQL